MIQDIETEKAILAGILKHGKDGLVEVSDLIKGENFASDNHQLYYSCLEHALGRSNKIDKSLFISSGHILGFENLFKNNKKEIDDLFNLDVEFNNIRLNAKRVAKLSIARTGKNRLRAAMNEIDEITGEESLNSILSIIEKPGFDIQKLINTNDEDGGLISKNAVSYIEELIKTPNKEIGILTGLKNYDKAIGGGIRPGGFALIGARRKIGKSSLAINVAIYVALKLGLPVLYLDTEMQCDDHLSRILANQTDIPISCIEHATFTNNKMLVEQLRSKANYLQDKLNITHQSVSSKDFDEILSIIRRWLMKKVGYHSSGRFNNCLIIYDYFKLSDPSSLKNLKEYEAIGYQAVKLSDFLKENVVPCLAFVQLNRECDIAQSDRLSWNATSVCLFMEKSQDEIITDGVENGNRKIVFDVARFGQGLEKDDYINVDFNGSLCKTTELCTAYEAKLDRDIGKSGYKTKEDNDDSDRPF